MMKIKRKLPFILSLWAGFCLAEEAPSPLLPWSECQELLKKNNPELISAEHDSISKEHSLTGSYSGFFPELSASGSFERSKSLIDYGEPKYDKKTAGIYATQNIFSGFSDWEKIRMARIDKNQSDLNLKILKAKLLFQLKEAFSNLQYAEELLKLNKSVEVQKARNYRMVELRYNAGHENRGSLLVAKASWEDSKLEIEKSENLKRQNSLALAKILGLSQKENLKVSGKIPLSNPLNEKNDAQSLANYVKEAPEFQLALQKEKSSEASVALAHSAFYPNLNLSGGITQQKKDWEDKTREWNMAVTLSIPLFSGMKDYYSSKAAYENLASSRIQIKSTYDDLYLRFRQTLDALVEAHRKSQVEKIYTEAVQVQVEIGRKQYSNGVISFPDWDRLEQDYVSHQKEILEVNKDLIVKSAAWEQLLGKGSLL